MGPVRVLRRPRRQRLGGPGARPAALDPHRPLAQRPAAPAVVCCPRRHCVTEIARRASVAHAEGASGDSREGAAMSRTWTRTLGAACAARDRRRRLAVAVAPPAAANYIKSAKLAGEPVVGDDADRDRGAERARRDARVPLAAVHERRADGLRSDPKAPNGSVLRGRGRRRGRAARRCGSSRRSAPRTDAERSDITAVVTEPAPPPPPRRRRRRRPRRRRRHRHRIPRSTPSRILTSSRATTAAASTNPEVAQSGHRDAAARGQRAGGVVARRPRYLRPFPVVRITGTLVAGGARVSCLRVRAPADRARSTSAARDAGCPLRRGPFGGGRIRALERFLRAGDAHHDPRHASRRPIGKYVRLVIRDGTPPRAARRVPAARADPRPARCPSG